MNGAAFGAKDRFPVIGSAHIILQPGVLHNLSHIQYASVIVKSHIQTGNLQLLGVNPLEKICPASIGERFESTAALPGKFHPHPHIGTPIVMDTNAGKIFTVEVTMGTFGILPWAMPQSKRSNHFLRSMFFARKAQPVI